MAGSEGPAVTAMRDLRSAILERLRENEDFCALQALDTALATLSAGRTNLPPSVVSPHADRVMNERMSQADAALAVIRVRRIPMSTTNLLKEMPALTGITVGGSDPALNLSSTLSRDDRFESLSWDGRKCWWVSQVEVPPEPKPSNRPVVSSGQAALNAALLKRRLIQPAKSGEKNEET